MISINHTKNLAKRSHERSEQMIIYPPPTSPLKGGGSRFDENSSIFDNLFPL